MMTVKANGSCSTNPLIIDTSRHHLPERRESCHLSSSSPQSAIELSIVERDSASRSPTPIADRLSACSSWTFGSLVSTPATSKLLGTPPSDEADHKMDPSCLINREMGPEWLIAQIDECLATLDVGQITGKNKQARVPLTLDLSCARPDASKGVERALPSSPMLLGVPRSPCSAVEVRSLNGDEDQPNSCPGTTRECSDLPLSPNTFELDVASPIFCSQMQPFSAFPCDAAPFPYSPCRESVHYLVTERDPNQKRRLPTDTDCFGKPDGQRIAFIFTEYEDASSSSVDTTKDATSSRLTIKTFSDDSLESLGQSDLTDSSRIISLHPTEPEKGDVERSNSFAEHSHSSAVFFEKELNASPDSLDTDHMKRKLPNKTEIRAADKPTQEAVTNCKGTHRLQKSPLRQADFEKLEVRPSTSASASALSPNLGERKCQSRLQRPKTCPENDSQEPRPRHHGTLLTRHNTTSSAFQKELNRCASAEHLNLRKAERGNAGRNFPPSTSLSRENSELRAPRRDFNLETLRSKTPTPVNELGMKSTSASTSPTSTQIVGQARKLNKLKQLLGEEVAPLVASGDRVVRANSDPTRRGAEKPLPRLPSLNTFFGGQVSHHVDGVSPERQQQMQQPCLTHKKSIRRTFFTSSSGSTPPKSNKHKGCCTQVSASSPGRPSTAQAAEETCNCAFCGAMTGLAAFGSAGTKAPKFTRTASNDNLRHLLAAPPTFKRPSTAQSGKY